MNKNAYLWVKKKKKIRKKITSEYRFRFASIISRLSNEFSEFGIDFKFITNLSAMTRRSHIV